MGNRGCTIVVQTEQKTNIASSMITGKIYVSVHDQEGISCNSLNIHFTGYEYAKVHYTASSGSHNGETSHYETHQETFLDQFYLIHEFPNQIISRGHYEFPFQLHLPEYLPSSMFYRRGESYCEVKYQICATLASTPSRVSMNPFCNNGMTSKPHEVVILRQPIHINSNLQSNVVLNNIVHFPSDEKRVNKCCCINKGYMIIDAQMQKLHDAFDAAGSTQTSMILCDGYTGTVYMNPQSTFRLPYRILNQSTTHTRSIQMELIERVTWKPRFREENHSTSVVFEKKMMKIEGIHEIFRGRYNPLASLVGENACDQQEFSLTIPTNIRDSYQGNLIQVSHILRITINTEFCISNPSTSLDVVITRSLLRVDASDDTGMNEMVTPTAPMMEEPMVIDDVDVISLPDDWSPQTADMVDLPVATVIGFVSDTQQTDHVPVAWQEIEASDAIGIPEAAICDTERMPSRK